MCVEGGSFSNTNQDFGVMMCEQAEKVNYLIAHYAKCGKLKHAIFLYKKSKVCEKLSPRTLVALLKACAEIPDVESGREIHADISRQELDKDVFVGSTLINFYASCGFLEEAQEVFYRLGTRDLVCWNALIAGYVKHGHGEEALYYTEQMQYQGISPNTVTFVCGLKACSSLGIVDKGQKLHAEIVRRELLNEHHFVGNALVDMYAKCGLLAQAQEVFSELLVRDSLSWTALVVGYANAGSIKVACKYLKLMKSDGVPPNSMVFLSILNACSVCKAVELGLELHADIIRTGLLEKDPAIGIRLLDMYASNGWFKQAQEVLDEYCAQEVVAWTTLITYYVKYELCKEALECYKTMQERGVFPNSITFISCLKACSKMQALDMGLEIHNKINRLGLLERNLVMGNALLDMYANCGSIIKLQEVFDVLVDRDVVSWTALIAGYTNNEHGGEALKHFDQMKVQGITPDAVTYSCALKACARIGAADKGIKVHDEISENVLLRKDLVIANALIDMYASCGLLSKAQLVLDELPVQDVISWTALVAGLIKYGYDEEALECFDQMQQKGILLDDFALVYGLEVCGSLGAVGKGQELHIGVLCSRSDCCLLVGNALIDMYAKCSFVSIAMEIFNTLASKDEASWNALITGYAQLGEIDNVIFYYNKLVKESNKPNSITFVSILTACSHSGLVELADAFFEVMIEENSITPTLEHFTCMIDLLGRAGQLDKMVARIRQTPHQPSLVMWHSSLGACMKWGNVDLGRAAMDHALQVDKNDVGSFVVLSNMCQLVAAQSSKFTHVN